MEEELDPAPLGLVPADKRPYKTHLDLWFWQGSGPSRACPGYWFQLTSSELLLGAGMRCAP